MTLIPVTHTRIRAQTPTRTLSFVFLSLTHTYPNTLTRSHTHTHTNTHTHTHSLSLSLPNTHTHTHTHEHKQRKCAQSVTNRRIHQRQTFRNTHLLRVCSCAWHSCTTELKEQLLHRVRALTVTVQLHVGTCFCLWRLHIGVVT